MRWGIKHQVLLLALVPTITISVLLGAYFTSTRLQDIEETFRKHGEAIALKLAPAGEYGVFSHNVPLLQELAAATLAEHNAQSVAFYTPKGAEITAAGAPIFHFMPPKEAESLTTKVFIKENGETIAFVVPITIYKEVNDVHSAPKQTEKLIGWLKLELETKSIHLRAHQMMFNTGLIILLGLSIGGLLAFQMGRKITKPILELAEAVERIKQGELNTRIQISAYRELEILKSGINTMAQSLENAHTELQNKIVEATLSLRRSLETIEVQNIELEIARKAAENANNVKSEFLADMSHEIRTPLNGVIGFINLLQKTELSPKQQEYITTIQKSAGNLLAIINDILDFSKIEAGKLRIDHAPMDIRDCIDETLNLLAPYAHEKNIALIPLVYSDIPMHVLGDPLRIKQIITNLVNNSIKFTDHGSVIVRVMLESETYSQITIRVSVTDTGIGISKEEQKALFQAFNQTKIGTSRKFGGTGLGLVICKKLVEQMGGNIGVESEPQKGATFWFTFQVETCSEVAHFLDDKLIAPEAVDPIHSNELSLSFHVLAVDDNPENLKLITVLLEEMGIQVTAVNSGKDAIEAIHQQSFNLILMDIRMPNMNGIETTETIRNFEATHRLQATPIIALTAHALMSEKKALLAAGIDDYLAKPIGEAELTALLYKWLKQNENEKVIDWEMGEKLAGGKLSLAKEFFEKLTLSLPQDKALINDVFQKKNWELMRDHVHKLHGGCCYCGVPQLRGCAQKLESALANRTYDLVKPRLDALNLAIDAVLTASENAVKQA